MTLPLNETHQHPVTSHRVQNGQAAITLNLPGEAGVWLLVMGDMLMFSCLFVVFTWYRSGDPGGFAASASLLNQDFGLLNTVLMLTSSWFVVLAVRGAHASRPRVCVAMFTLAFLCGLSFVVSKTFEWSEKIGDGHTMMSNDFFMFYYVLTGLHCLHVILGLGVLAIMIVLARTRGHGAPLQLFESGATFWHMVDLLWIILFPLLYIVR